MKNMRSASSQQGATYVWLLLAVALLATASARVAQSWSSREQREREDQLLFIGAQYRSAVESYYEQTPGPHKRLPDSIEQLLDDKRFPQAQRHLRQRYADPITQRDDWQLVHAPDGALLGVRSASTRQPFKRSGFDGDQITFNDAPTYADWYFVYVPPALAGTVLPSRAFSSKGL